MSTRRSAEYVAGLRSNVVHQDGLTVMTVAGAVDLSTGDEFRTRLVDAFDDTAPTVVVDLSGVDFFGLIGLQVLLDVGAQVSATHGLRLVTGVRSVDRVLDVVGAVGSLERFVSVDAALADVRTKCDPPASPSANGASV
ncbi:MAG: STAS domain-containing protein [Nocardiaceae bacterium]|nr:STAS domain-containing protein [Nocardiaceae bacterium]